jgi:hypothetical protein
MFSDADRHAVLHTLVVKGFASAEAIGHATGIAPGRIVQVLAELRDEGFATLREGRLTGWSPTPAARERHRELVAGPLAPVDGEHALSWYEQFRGINADLKQLCTDWQVRTAADGSLVPNDHADAGYDRIVLERLHALDARIGTVCADITHSLPRISRYRDRLADALAAIEAGDRERFTKPLSESYHDIWMELHQDLLLTLGLERTAADA